MKVHACWLYKKIILKDVEILVRRVVKLPFVPFEGLLISIDEAAYGHFWVQHVTYSIEKDAFWLGSIDDAALSCPCNETDSCCIFTDEYIVELLSEGWDVEEIRKGRERHWSPEGVFRPDEVMFPGNEPSPLI